MYLPDYFMWMILYSPQIALVVIQVIAMILAWKAVQNLGGERGLAMKYKITYTIIWPFALLLWLLTRALKA
jgi:hypothetical protein